MQMKKIIYAGIVLALNYYNASAATFTVSNINDSGTGSLRKAITDANSNGNPSIVDVIVFNISIGPYVINIPSFPLLPTITEPLFIDGSTQPGFSSGNIITLVGPSPFQGGALLKVSSTAPNSEIRGLQLQKLGTGIEAFNVSQVTINGNYINECTWGIDVSGSSISIINNRVGTDFSGSVDNGNFSDGIRIRPASNNILIEDNIVSANLGSGILLSGHLIRNITIRNNKVGTDISGITNLGNTQNAGISFGLCNIDNADPDSCLIEGNLISGNLKNGIYLKGADFNFIRNNKIGTNILDDPMGNGEHGIMIDPACTDNSAITDRTNLNNKIGGYTAGDENIIAYNGGDGIHLLGKQSSFFPNFYSNFNRIARNRIYGNGYKAINLNYTIATPFLPGNSAKPKPIINSYENDILSGTSEPNDIIEIFGSTGSQNANMFLTTTNADGSGNWSVNINTSAFSHFISTATDPFNSNSPELENTSELSNPIIVNPFYCINCIGSFSPEAGEYILNLWVKESGAGTEKLLSYPNAGVQVSFSGSSATYTFMPAYPDNPIIDGWQRIEEKFSIPSGATQIHIKLLNNGTNVAFF